MTFGGFTMKKLLLNGTAVAGLALALTATPAAAELELGLGGHFSAYGVFASQDDGAGEPGADLHEFELMREAEVYFMGETTLDNGLTVGAEIQLEGQTDGGDQIDESYIYMSGDWGRLNVGSENGAAYLLQVGAPAVDKNFDGIDPEYIVVDGTNSALLANGRGLNYGMGIGGQNDRGDTDKFTYLSPVFSGFQFGASYSASLQEDASVRDGFTSDAAAGGALKDSYEVAARWAGEFDGVGVTAGAGWAQAEQEDEVAGEDDREQWNVGLNFNVSGFTFGGAYFEDNNAVDSDGETTTYALGVNYETGPYTVGASYLASETETGASTEDELSRVLVGGSYAYGPGMSFNGAVHFYELEDDASAPAAENDATVVTLGTVVKF